MARGDECAVHAHVCGDFGVMGCVADHKCTAAGNAQDFHELVTRREGQFHIVQKSAVPVPDDPVVVVHEMIMHHPVRGRHLLISLRNETQDR